MKFYKYTLLKQDGTEKELGIMPKQSFQMFYKILNCHTIEIIPTAYFNERGYGKCTMYGDEEARFDDNNKRNPHFNVLKGDVLLGEPAEWDIVGDIIKEEVNKGK